jgi:hypothetical protein
VQDKNQQESYHRAPPSTPGFWLESPPASAPFFSMNPRPRLRPGVEKINPRSRYVSKDTAIGFPREWYEREWYERTDSLAHRARRECFNPDGPLLSAEMQIVRVIVRVRGTKPSETVLSSPLPALIP